MKTIEGYDVRIFTDNIEDKAVEQLKTLLSIDAFSENKIRGMPDVHAGAGCVIGFTGDMGDKVIPNIVGVDIGCGMRVVPFTSFGEIDHHSFNQHILQNIPSGRNAREGQVILDCKYMETYSHAKELIKSLRCYRDLKDSKRLNRSIGTLGGGNHFIELDRDENGLYYLVVHTGSRDLGRQVAQIYQKTAVKNQSGWDELMAEQKRMIEEYKATGRRPELQEAIRQLHSSFKMRRPSVPDDLCWLTGESREDYLHDMRICQEWAVLNRGLISAILMGYLQESGSVTEMGRHSKACITT